MYLVDVKKNLFCRGLTVKKKSIYSVPSIFFVDDHFRKAEWIS